MREALRALERRAYRRLRSKEALRAAQARPAPWSLDALGGRSHCLLITRRRDGRLVPTPVWFALADQAIVVRSGASDAKVARIRANDKVLVCACTPRGRPLAAPMRGRARILDGDAATHAESALRSRYGWDRRLYALLRDPLLDVAYLAVEPDDA